MTTPADERAEAHKQTGHEALERIRAELAEKLARDKAAAKETGTKR